MLQAFFFEIHVNVVRENRCINKINKIERTSFSICMYGFFFIETSQSLQFHTYRPIIIIYHIVVENICVLYDFLESPCMTLTKK